MMGNHYVVIIDRSAGNESVGEMWQETKMFNGNATLNEVMLWAMNVGGPLYAKHTVDGPSMRRITLTKPHDPAQEDDDGHE